MAHLKSEKLSNREIRVISSIPQDMEHVSQILRNNYSSLTSLVFRGAGSCLGGGAASGLNWPDEGLGVSNQVRLNFSLEIS